MADDAKQVRRVTIALLICMVAYAFANSLLSVLLNDVIDAFSIAGAKQGLMTSMMSVGTLAAILVTPLLQGRFSKRSVILASGVILGVGSVLTASAGSFFTLLALCVFIGLGVGWIDVDLSADMLDTHPRDSTKYLSLLHGFYGVGGLAAPLVIAAMMTSLSWRGAYRGVGLLVLAAVGAAALLFRSGQKSAAASEEKLKRADLSAYFSSGRNWVLIACAFLSFVMQTTIIAWVVRYFKLSFGTDALGGAAISIYWVCLTISRFLFPRLHMKPMRLYTLGSLLFALVMAAGILLHSPAALCVACGLGGLTSGHMIPVMIGVCAVGYEGKSTLTTSIVMLTMCIGRFVTPLLMAWLTAAVSADAGMYVAPVSGLLGVAFGLLAMRRPAAE